MSMNESGLNKLNNLLANEMSACKSYQQAKDLVDDDVVRDQIAECELSHKQRAQQLKTHIEELGATPVEECAVWNALAEVCGDGIRGVKDKDAVSALELGEELNLQMYQEELETADSEVRDIVLEQLLPAQEYTHDAVSILKISLQ